MAKKTGFYPIDVDKYPNINNCLAFALGQLKELPSSSADYILDPSLSIPEAFIYKCKEFGIKARIFRDFGKKLADDEYLMFVYSNIFLLAKNGISVPVREFHIVRQEPSGALVHKPGWFDPPEVVTSEILAKIKKLYPKEPAIFLLKVGE